MISSLRRIEAAEARPAGGEAVATRVHKSWPLVSEQSGPAIDEINGLGIR